MKYNMAPPAPRLGLTKRNTYASLHTKAHDKHAGPLAPSKNSNADPENGDFNRPPEESDEDSDVASNTEVSTPEIKKVVPDTMATGIVGADSTKYFVQKKKLKPAATYGKGKRTGSSQSVQKARPPRQKTTMALGFTRPAETKLRKGLLEKLDDEQEFNHDIVPSKACENESDADYEHFQHPPTDGTKNTPKANGSVALLTAKNDGFIAPPVGVPLGSQPFVSSQLSDLHDEIDEFIKQRAGKTRSQNDPRHDADSGRPAKKRRITPEPEFVAPPPPLSSLNTNGLSSGISPDLALPEGSMLPYIDTSVDASSPTLEISLTHSQQSACPMCLIPVEQATIDDFKTQNKLSSILYLSTRRQELFHKFHAKKEARSLWQERKYPSINWAELGHRLIQHKAHLLSIVEGQQPSHFATRLQKTLSRRGRRSAILADERRAGETSAQDLGYYGTRGQRSIGDWLVGEFSTQLRQLAPDNALIKLAGGVGGYIAKVLVPEAIQQLIKQDLWDTEGMLSALQTRIRHVASASVASDVGETKQADRDLRALLEGVALELGVSLPDLQCLGADSDTLWLARFAAADSAQCGLLLSEEMEDVVRLEDDNRNNSQDIA